MGDAAGGSVAVPRGSGSEPGRCENCDAALVGPFCAECGQNRRSPVVSLRAFLSQVAGDVASLDSRLARSLRALLFSPGTLTREYLEGKRVRYTSPVQLYLLAAAAFFLVASYRPFLWVDTARRQVNGALPGMTVGNDVTNERLERLSATGVSMELFAERFIDAVNAYLPVFLVGSVVLFSFVLHVLQRRRERRYMPHAVFALHWTAFYLLLMALARMLPPGWRLQDMGMLLAFPYLTVALRRVYGQGLWPSLGKAFVLLFAFLLILVIWMQSAVALGMLMV